MAQEKLNVYLINYYFWATVKGKLFSAVWHV